MGRPDTAGKRIKAFMDDIGVLNENDDRNLAQFHSFRHRAKTRLNQAVRDDELRNAIGGWSDGKTKKNAGWNYGKWPIKVLKETIDKIGGL
jgi:hypothetical protein